MKAIGYIRVSTGSQAEDGASLDVQRAKIEAWCKAHGYELVGIESDAGVSGAKELAKRPGLLRALSVAKSEKVTALVIYKRDRLARDVMVAAMAERLFAKVGAKVVATEGASNGDAPEDVLMRGIVDLFAQYERLLIATRTSAALQHMKAQGRRVGSVPHGYKLAEDGQHVEPDTNQQDVLRQVAALKAEGMTLRDISAELARLGVFNRNGRPFHPESIKHMVKAA